MQRVQQRDDIDPIGEDTERLLSLAEGQFTIEESVMNCLQMFFAENTDNTAMLVDPCRFIGGTDQIEDKDDPALTISTVVYELVYESPLDQSGAALGFT